ncbi:MAG: type II secretion system protein GspG [Patescibacteria group bacterium]|nr:type II secretion system protein GspG [Patescibacteria group bacterium]
MDDYKLYLLEELKQCDQKLQKLNDIQTELIKFYFTTVFAMSTIIVTLVNYKIYSNTNVLMTWFLLLPLLLFGYVVWFSLKKILIQYEYYEDVRNQISQIFLKTNSDDYRFQFFRSPFKYFYALISWLLIINLFAFLYSAVPFLSKMAVSTYSILIIVAIVTILLSTISTIILNSARKKARDAKRISDIKQLQTALEMYYNDNNLYPIASNTDELSKVISAEAHIVYMSNLPKDPLNKEKFLYSYRSDKGTEYEITYCLEEGGDMKANQTGINIK